MGERAARSCLDELESAVEWYAARRRIIAMVAIALLFVALDLLVRRG